MGCVFSCEFNSNILRDSPLGLLLKNWRELTSGESLLLKSRLIRLSEKVWPIYELNNDETWPEFSSLDKKLILSLISRICEAGYFEELEYARLFMFLSCQQSPSATKKEHILLLRKKEK